MLTRSSDTNDVLNEHEDVNQYGSYASMKMMTNMTHMQYQPT